LKKKQYFKYWAKARPRELNNPTEYHLLPYHCLDVAALGSALIDIENRRWESISTHLEVKAEWLKTFFVFCLALHDLGKFARSFQGLLPNLSPNLVKHNSRMSYTERHDTLGFFLWQYFINSERYEQVKPDWLQIILPWMKIVFGHHGVPPKQSGVIVGNFFEQEDKNAAWQFFSDAVNLLLNQFDPTPLYNRKLSKKLKPVSWQLAGLTVMADWLGSNQSYFTYHSKPVPLEEYWSVAVNSAEKAVKVLPPKPLFSEFSTITNLFPFINTPTPLQKYSENEPLSDSPHLFILEDVTGAGKTEAALTLTHRLLSAGLADGLYLALPTMATANAMYERLGAVYRQFYKQKYLPSLVLAHGARQLSKNFRESVQLLTGKTEEINYSSTGQVKNKDLSGSAFCNAWLADSRKKSLLADIGVGTVDQALLAVLPARHQCLRLLGLGRKVLLVDEVHSYDPYMLKILETLLTFHAKQGGSVILLSATLPQVMREDLVAAFESGINKDPSPLTNQAYPLATHIPATDQHEQYIDTRAEVKRTVKIRRLDNTEAAIEQIKHAVQQGKCICWIRNTVKEARASHQIIYESNWADKNRLHLFHSRFAMIDRQNIEKDTLERFGKNSKHEDRHGQILIATQVIEQSLDLDFDLMITDLAPIDLVIQRAGRLCRHIRDSLGNRITEPEALDQRGKPVLFIFSPAVTAEIEPHWLKEQQPGTQAVYPHLGQLWLTANLLFGTDDTGQFTMPDDARRLIEGVYSPEAEEAIPEPLQEISWDAEGQHMMQLSMANLNVLNLSKGYTRRSGDWDEESRTPTRLSETVTISIALASYQDGKLTPYAQNVYLPWAMSTVKIPEREWNAAKDIIPAKISTLIEELKAEEKSLRWLEIFPLCDATKQYYQADRGWQPKGV